MGKNVKIRIMAFFFGIFDGMLRYGGSAGRSSGGKKACEDYRVGEYKDALCGGQF